VLFLVLEGDGDDDGFFFFLRLGLFTGCFFTIIGLVGSSLLTL